ncbi:SPOSA6832_01457, partial [Sporobolomyces salmonicolor]
MPYNPASGIYTAALPPVELPTQPLSIFDFLFADRSSSDSPAPWLISADSPTVYTRSQAHQRALDLARAFHELGLRDGNTTLVFSPNHIDYGPCLWGTFRQGGIASCANPSYTPSELAYQLKTVNEHHPVKVLLTHPDSVVTAVQACEQAGFSTEIIVLMQSPSMPPVNVMPLSRGFPTLDDLIEHTRHAAMPPKVSIKPEEARTKVALLSFSSGTTGLPKAVVIPHFATSSGRSLGSYRRHPAIRSANEEGRRGRWLFALLAAKGISHLTHLLLDHIYGLVVVLHGSLYLNTPLVVMPKFTLPIFLDAIQRHRISILFVVPPMIIMLIKQDTSKYNLSSIKLVMAGAAPLTEETLSAFQQKFDGFIGQGYGMTETSTIVSLFDCSWKGGFPGASAGLLAPNIEAKIVSPEGKPLPPGEIGELWSRGPANALGYLGNEKATAETFDDEGFVHTGDECRMDEQGCLYVVDRIKERVLPFALIKVSGYQVAPAELEGHLLTHPDVQDVAVIGIPDEKRGEAPKAYVVPSSAFLSQVSHNSTRQAEQARLALVASIKKHVLDHKIKYKALVEVEFMEAIPKTPSGKLLRKDLRVRHAKTVKARAAKL